MLSGRLSQHVGTFAFKLLLLISAIGYIQQASTGIGGNMLF